MKEKLNCKTRFKQIIILLSFLIMSCGGPSIRVGSSIKEVPLQYLTKQVLLDGENYCLVKLLIDEAPDKIVLVRKKDGIILHTWKTYELEKAIVIWNIVEKNKTLNNIKN